MLRKQHRISGLLLIGIIAITAIMLNWGYQHKRVASIEAMTIDGEINSDVEKSTTGIWGALDWLASRRVNQKDGVLDYRDYYKAYEQVQKFDSKRGATLGLKWVELGPDNLGGRTRVVLIDNSDPNLLYAGGVAGGLWTSVNAGAVWYRVNAIDSNIAVAALTQTANGDIYVGTGEGLYYNFGYGYGGLPGNGIHKSTDGGNTFQHLASTQPDSLDPNIDWAHVNELAADPSNSQRVYAATTTGLLITDDGGTTWVRKPGLGTTSEAGDVKVATDGSVWASIGSSIYFSLTGDVWNNISTPIPTYTDGPKSFARAEIGIAYSDPNYVYIITVKSNGSLRAVYQTKDQGLNWKIIGPGTSSFNPVGQQGTYDLCIAVAPDDKEKIFIGGQRGIYKWISSANWSKQSGGGNTPSNQYYVHADQHFIVFDNKNPNRMYIGCDGGVHKSVDQGETFTHNVKKYNVTQFYSVAASITGEVMGGTQDNGTNFIGYVGHNSIQNCDHIKGADGGYVEFSEIKPNVYFAESQYGRIQRSKDRGLNWENFTDSNFPSSYSSAFVSPFYLWEGPGDTVTYTHIKGVMPPNPIDSLDNMLYDTSTYTKVNPRMYFFATNGTIYMTKEALLFDVKPQWKPEWFRINSFGLSGGSESMAHSSDGDVVYVGTSTGKVYRIDGIKDAVYGYRHNCDIIDSVTFDCDFYPDSAGIITRELIDWAQVVTGIAVNPNDEDHIVVTLGNYGNSNFVYQCMNASDSVPTFVSIQNNLPLMPVYSAVIDAKNPNTIYLATEFGIYGSSDGGASWTEENGGEMERVATFMIRQEPHPKYTDSFALYIGTHGRGLFSAGFDPKKDFLSINDPIEPVKSSNFVVYPNPLSNVGYLDLELTRKEDIEIRVYDINGRQVLNSLLKDYPPGKHRIRIDASSFPRGTYFIGVYYGEEYHHSKMIVLR